MAAFTLNASSVTTVADNSSTTADHDYYDYDYDYDASVSYIPLAELVPVSLVYGLTLVLGVTGNLLVILSVTRYRRMQNVTNTFLISLASADLILVLICVPIKLAKWLTFTWVFGEVMCKLVHYLQNVSVISSVLTLTTISIERYYAILHPIRAKYTCTVERARRVSCVIWILAFLLATPILFGQVHKQVGVRRVAYWCIREWPSPFYSRLYELAMLLLLLLVPLVVMSLAYCSICKELWVMTSRRAAMRAGSESQVQDPRATSDVRRRRQGSAVTDDSTRKQVIKMLVAVIILFTVCWGPTLIDNLLVAYGYVEKMNYGHLKYMRQTFVFMSYFNSCINPIVYAFMSKNFRESFKYALCICVHGKIYARQYKYRRQASFQTGSTTIRPDTSFQTGSTSIRPDTSFQTGSTTIRPDTSFQTGSTSIRPDTSFQSGSALIKPMETVSFNNQTERHHINNACPEREPGAPEVANTQLTSCS